MRIHHTERGSAVLMAVMGLLVLGGIGATSVAIVSTHEEERAMAQAMDQAAGLSQAGIEYALNQISEGGVPNVTNMPFGEGTVTVTTTPAANLVVAVGQVGTVRSTHSITTNFAKDCVSLDFATAHSASDRIVSVKILKACQTRATIVAWTIGWAPDSAMTNQKLQIQGDVIYDVYEDFSGYTNGQLVDGADYVVNKDDGVTPINFIEFSQTLTPGVTYTMTMHFADGSAKIGSFVDPG